MTNKSGAIGTRTETAIVRYARANGFAGADEMTRSQRLRLNGSHDQGDIGLCPGVMIQSKGGHMAEQASDAQIAAWLTETEAQRQVRGCPVAFLVTKRKGKGERNAGQWWAHLPGSLFTLRHNPDARVPAVRMTLDAALSMLRDSGYGDRVEPEGAETAPERHGEPRTALLAGTRVGQDAHRASEGREEVAG